MEKSEAIRRFNEGKHYIETCLEQIASLEQNNDKELRQVLRGTVMVEVSYKAAENFCKVGSYVIDGKDGAQKLKDKLINMKVKVLQLYNGADRNNLLMIKNICDTIISEINEVEEWTGDNEQTVLRTNLTDNIDIPETGESGNEGIGEKPKADEMPVTKENEDDSIDNVFAKLENRYVLAYKKAFSLDEYKYRGFYEKCKNKTPLEIAELFYNDAEVPDGKIKAVYYVCVVPNMTEENQCVYETFLNYYNACDGR